MNSLRNLLDVALKQRESLRRSPDLDVYRVLDGEVEGVPGLRLDRYGAWGVIHCEPERLGQISPKALAEAVSPSLFRGIYLKRHPREAHRLTEQERAALAPRSPFLGEPAPEVLLVHEGPRVLRVRLADGLSTGLYLDQRANRDRLMQRSRGRRVLNLFAYTCSFTVAAALGGAQATVSVDTSQLVLDQGAENLRENQLTVGTSHRFVRDDAVSYVRRAMARGDRFDIIILDPPSFAAGKGSTFRVEHDLADLVASCLLLLSSGGALLLSTNHRATPLTRLRALVRLVARQEGISLRSVESAPSGIDFPSVGTETGTLAALWILR